MYVVINPLKYVLLEFQTLSLDNLSLFHSITIYFKMKKNPTSIWSRVQ